MILFKHFLKSIYDSLHFITLVQLTPVKKSILLLYYSNFYKFWKLLDKRLHTAITIFEHETHLQHLNCHYILKLFTLLLNQTNIVNCIFDAI